MKDKGQWQRILLAMLEPLKKRFSSDYSSIILDGGGSTYSQRVIGLEAFARPLWGLVPFWYGGGREDFFEEVYLNGLISGTDPESSGYWGDASDDDQRFVEMAPIAFGLIAVPEILWNPLPVEAKNNLSRWLYQINDHEIPRCNWYFFRIIVNVALQRLGRKYSHLRLESDMEFIESCYLENGWYKDGVSGRLDYYSAFAMQYYPLLLAVFAGINIEQTKNRASLFAKDFIYFFASGGEAVAYGRSMTYRFAQSSFWSAYAFVSDNKDIGMIRSIIERNIDYWLEKRIYDNGILSIGYGYPNLTMAERYNGPGSPYWSLKTFLFLAFADDHPFWFSEEERFPELEQIKKESGRRVFHHRIWDVTMYDPGMLGMSSLGHFTEKYDKFCYSSSSPFSVSHSSESITEASPDSMLSFIVDDTVLVRKGSIEYSIDGTMIISKWSPSPKVRVDTVIMLEAEGHVRIHHIDSDIDCIAYDSGFSREKDESIQENRYAEVSSSGIHSSAECLKGEGNAVIIESDPNSNLLWPDSRIPAIKYQIRKGRNEISTRFRLWKEKK